MWLPKRPKISFRRRNRKEGVKMANHPEISSTTVWLYFVLPAPFVGNYLWIQKFDLLRGGQRNPVQERAMAALLAVGQHQVEVHLAGLECKSIFPPLLIP
ncbi:hypothetical protein AMD24_00001 [Candidatus Xiphinematobacter sp. Idaho Grape]|nr:hypothetical protein AMD24_00001 [Candidatus Xiphinematobacter sp. Idaho Grape]